MSWGPDLERIGRPRLVGKGRNVHTQTHLLRSIVAATGDSLGARVSERPDNRIGRAGEGVEIRNGLGVGVL